MQTLSLSSPRTFSLHKTHLPSVNEARVLHFTHHSSFFHFKPLRASSNCKEMMLKKRPRGFGPVCYSAPFTPSNLQWISTVSTAVLMFAKGTAIQKSFLVPLFALQATPRIISWIKGEYGIWTAFLALLVRLFFFIPGELELPFVALLLVIVAPYQVMNLRGTQEGAILSLVIAGYLAFQHCSWAGSLRKAFDRGPLVATLALICTFAVSCLLLI
ncbi:cold-regulated 413 inner membrane protein 1, chloroplastic-like [Actinidia eriantha]|uniref:cold-regulated 413 inner membrane protein 1, chloroplastic-like n=1 Tax=Actinidia eriantha TaxID=165200 RepID=UPI00258D0123|nr:cold-regulated 413 inner membrane protein 1, chloroplastic-like [Actinidia eriantha]